MKTVEFLQKTGCYPCLNIVETIFVDYVKDWVEKMKYRLEQFHFDFQKDLSKGLCFEI